MLRIRSITFMVYLIVSISVASIFAAPVVLAAPRKARGIAQTWARVTLRVLKFLTGVSFKIEGAENIPTSGVIVAANHQSQWETLALYALLPKPVVILKTELLRIPLYGWWMKRVGNIAVDRKGGAKALRALRTKTAERLAQGEQILVFPEGTRSAIGERLPYHSGVAGIYAHSGAPCVPVAHNSGEYWRYPGIDKIPGEITMRFLPVIAPGLGRKEFLRQLQSAIEGARPDLALPGGNPVEESRTSDG